jgi:membrane-associated phospholipid phosphatase
MPLVMGIQAWDIWLIQSLQNTGDWLEPVMKFFTALGYPHAYMVVVAIVYWSLDRKLGLRLAIFLPLVSSLNSILKLAFHAPRPYWVSTEIQAIHASNGFGMPSGHAQASTVWLLVGSYLRNKWFWIIAILITFLIGLSRSFLGVHFPTQVVAGWAIGIAVIICFIRIEEGVVSWFQKLKFYWRLLFVMGITVLIILSGAIILMITGSWEMPLDWIGNASPYLSLDKTLLRSYSMASIAGNAGSFLGVTMGAILMGRAGGFRVAAEWWIQLLRIILGLACMFLLYAGLRIIAPGEEDLLVYATWRFLGFYLISLLAVYLLPMLYIRLKLMKAEQ